MSRGIRIAARFMLIVAVVSSTAYLVAPASSTGSPYSSSLSVLGSAPAYAAPGGCTNRICNVLRNPPDCTARMDGMKCKVTGQGCSATVC